MLEVCRLKHDESFSLVRTVTPAALYEHVCLFRRTTGLHARLWFGLYRCCEAVNKRDLRATLTYGSQMIHAEHILQMLKFKTPAGLSHFHACVTSHRHLF